MGSFLVSAERMGPAPWQMPSQAYRNRTGRATRGAGGSHGLTNCTTADASTTVPASHGSGQTNIRTNAQKPAANTGTKLKRWLRRGSAIFHQRMANKASAK